ISGRCFLALRTLLAGGQRGAWPPGEGRRAVVCGLLVPPQPCIASGAAPPLRTLFLAHCVPHQVTGGAGKVVSALAVVVSPSTNAPWCRKANTRALCTLGVAAWSGVNTAAILRHCASNAS